MRLRIDRSHQSQPVGGWSYPCKDGPVLTSAKVGAPGLDELLTSIAEYRLSNGLPKGDPEHDVALHYALLSPWLIKEVEGEESPVVKTEAWIHQAWKSYPLALTDAREMDARYAQCEKCFHFQLLKKRLITPEAVRRLLCMNPYKYRDEHGWCALRGWVISVAVQLRNPAQLTTTPEPDERCWLK